MGIYDTTRGERQRAALAASLAAAAEALRAAAEALQAERPLEPLPVGIMPEGE